MLRTTDGGTTWLELNIGNTESLQDGLFVNDSVGYLCSNHGIYYTSDFGLSWTLVYNNNSSNITSIDFISPSIGYMNTGPYLLKTTNGGLNWDITCPSNMVGDVECVRFFDAYFGIFTIYGGFWSGTTGAISTFYHTYVTTDGGENWNQFTITAFKSISFTNAKYAFMVGYDGVIYKIDFETANFIDRTTELPTLIYPNPNNGEFTVSLNSTSIVEAYSQSGQLVFKAELKKGEHKINLSDLPSAMYILKVNSVANYKEYKIITTR